MTDLLNIAYVQPDIEWHNIDGNLHQYDKMLADVSDADLIVLPEMFATGFTNQIEGTAQTMDGSAVKWMLRMASVKKAALMGSLLVEDKGLYFNRLMMAYPDGRLEWYDKRHLFRMGCEHESLTPGSEIKIFEYHGWRIRPIVCYDLRFPVWIRNTGNNYDLLVCVANWPTARHSIFETLLRARSIENQCYTVGVNRVGIDGLGIGYSGGSSVIDIYGNVMSQLADNQTGVGRTTISFSKLKAFRDKFPTVLDADEFSIKI
jgi:predicted amidohydrolase